MARTKAPPIRREPSEIKIESNGTTRKTANGRTDVARMLDNTLAEDEHKKGHVAKAQEPGTLNLILSVACIYASFLTWGILQERITTTTYGSSAAPQRWNYPVFLNTVQSILASIVGFAYLSFTTSHPHKAGRPAPIFPSITIVKYLLLVAITSSLASPFGYASLKHIDYITFVLAKSCKLLPVMFLHVTLYRRKYPLHKYAVVILVTLGVATFTLYAPSLAGKAAKHSAKNAAGANKTYGLFLLSLNLLFDGLTNTIQDDITARFKPYGAAQMMCALNILMTALTSTFLLLSPHLAPTSLGQTLNLGTGNELADALAFVKAYPQVGTDVIAFGLCGALGQVAIYHTLTNFGSLLLVTVTVTRKMFTMMLSIAWFGHKITGMQYAGVGMVFGGIGAEAVLKIRQTKEKERVAKARMLSEAGQDHGLRKKDK